MNLLKSLRNISFFTFCSRILGLIRDIIIAKMFGASIASDAFFVAFRIPNMLRRIFAEGVFSQAFIPILNEQKQLHTHKELKQFIAQTTGLLSTILVIISLISIVFAPFIIKILLPSFVSNKDDYQLVIDLFRILFPYIFFISLASLASAILNSWNQFHIAAQVPLLLNISMIIALYFMQVNEEASIISLAWAVLIGGIFQCIWQFPALHKLGLLLWPKIIISNQAVWEIVRKMGPAMIGVSSAQISLLINTALTSFFPKGTIACIYYSDRLMELPVALFAIPLTTILLPLLVKFRYSSQHQFSQLLDWGVRTCLLFALPSAVGMMVIAEPLIVTFFQYGHLTSQTSIVIKQLLMAYAFGMVGFMMIKILASAFYAQKNINTPAKIAVLTLIITQCLNLLLVPWLQQIGLILALSIGACCNMALLLWQLLRNNHYQPQKGWGSYLLKISSAAFIMGIVLMALLTLLPSWQDMILWSRIGWLITLILTAVASYFSILFLLGWRIRNIAMPFKRAEEN